MDGVATVDGQQVHTTRREYAILELLALRKGSTLTKDMILNHVYGGMDEPEIKIIDVFICKLRKKLTSTSGTSFIETVWGRGYIMPDLEAVEAQKKMTTASPAAETRRSDFRN